MLRLKVQIRSLQRTAVAYRSASTQTTVNRPSASDSASSSAQPFSTPGTPSPARSDLSTTESGGEEPAAPGRPASSVSAGTTLKGLNILKTGSDPVALRDEEYPEWVWSLVDGAEGESSLKEAQAQAQLAKSEMGDSKAMRKKNRDAIKRKNFFAGRF
ncbi:39S ribosomal protein L37, mitochondrial [Savitreella phatthalungensis]